MQCDDSEYEANGKAEKNAPPSPSPHPAAGVVYDDEAGYESSSGDEGTSLQPYSKNARKRNGKYPL